MNTTIAKPGETGGDYTALRFMVQQILSRVQTATLVKVVSVSAGGTGAAGSVDVLPMVNQLDGEGNGHELATLHNLPYLRVQGGANAVIIDPAPGDIGIAVFCSRDISTVKKTKAQSNPGSWATHSMSDGLYLGGVLNGAPSQYVQFGSGGITIHSPETITLSAAHVSIQSDSLVHNDSDVGDTHVHGGVEPGGSTTSTPQ